MWCPITFRINLGIKSLPIPSEELRLENNWLICRHLIVFSGNLLVLIYGLMVLILTNWFSNESLVKKDKTYRQILNNSYTTGVCLIIIASFGCLSLFIKSHFRAFVANFKDSVNLNDLNKGKPIRIVRYSGDDPQTLLDVVMDYSRRKLTLLKRCFTLSPVFSLNIVFITSLMPFEFSIVKKCIDYMIDHYTGYRLYGRNTSALILILSFNVFFISVILIHLIVFIYISDLINTSLDKESHLKHNILSPRKQSPILSRHLQNQMRIQELRRKNLLFRQFLYKSQSSEMSLTEVLSDSGIRNMADTSTIVISESSSDE